MEEIDAVVVGAGQAGLATSHELTSRGVEHVVLERDHDVGLSWAHRWDSFCLVTPNHTVRLPGGEYTGPEPHGYLDRAGIVAHLQAYAGSFSAPVRAEVEITACVPEPLGGLLLRTATETTIKARAVVVATGAFQKVHRPPWTWALADGPLVVDSLGYTSPDSLPEGAVLVLGSGQTGCQLAEELALAGRRVILACGRAAWLPRRIDGVDVVDCLLETAFFDQPLSAMPVPHARLLPNPQLSGTLGGHDVHTRTLAAMGVQLAGHVLGVSDGVMSFADDLAASVAWGDARREDLAAMIRLARASQGLPEPMIAPPPPFDAGAALRTLDLTEVATVILTMGYRPDYVSWIDVREAFDDLGFPVQVDGGSDVVPGLHFVGVHFLRSRASSLLMGVGRDAGIVAEQVAAHLGAR